MNTRAVPLRYGSMCSGIEATSVAWMPLGFLPTWFAEIDPFANAVLKHHYPHVPNLGDMQELGDKILSGEACLPDILVAGTPCQSFSVVGRRGGLSDPRGALALTYTEIANVIDEVRAKRQEPETILIWENVPGVLSDAGNAFGCFLGAIAGECSALQPAGHRWSHAGCVYGTRRSVAWRTLDAQYFGVAQRRKRVFVVASARADFDPVEVLFESDGLRRDSPPSHETWEEASATVGSDAEVASSEFHSGSKAQGYQAPVTCFGGGRTSGPITAAACLTARGHKCDFSIETFAVQAISGSVSHTLTARSGRGSSEDGTGRGTPVVAVHYQCSGSDLPGGFHPPAIAFAQNSRGELRLESDNGQVVGALSGGGGKPGQGFPAIASSSEPVSGAHLNLTHVPLTDSKRHGWAQWRIRRLMPIECERLQGLPDNYTLVPYRDSLAADGPRYRAIGQSMATQCMTWIGQRICQSLQTQSTRASRKGPRALRPITPRRRE